MKNLTILRVILLVTLLSFFLSPLKAQLDNIGEMMKAFQKNAPQDAEKLMKSYISPYTNALGTDLSGGWYNTAKPHGVLGFDLTFSLNTTFVPKSDQTFSPDKLGLETISKTGGETSPTAMGDNTSGAILNLKDTPGGQNVNIELPKGTGISFAPAPMLQGAIGLPKGTELIGRYTPTMKLGSQAEIGLWGVGIKHSIKQWIPALNKIPVLQLSVLGGYTKLSSETDLNFTPEAYGITNYNENTYSDQKMMLGLSSFTGNLLISANLPVVCFYGGVGITSSKTKLELQGNYPIPSENGVESVKDPIINLSIKHKDGSTTKPRYNAGIRFKFAVITLHFDYTYADYNVFTTGLGLSIR
jgi:hypothetical protein